MANEIKDTIPALLMGNIPRDLVMAVEDALAAGAERARSLVKGTDSGHLANALGQQRHFKMAESFHRALLVGNASPTPIKGNNLVTGQSGVFTLARFNIKQGFWLNGRRSQTRRQMSLANEAMESLVQPGLFTTHATPTNAVVFFVACFSGADSTASVQIAVPDHEMKGWLFREPLKVFLERYEVPASVQDDLVVPTLKKGIGKRKQDGATS